MTNTGTEKRQTIKLNGMESIQWTITVLMEAECKIIWIKSPK